MHPVVPMPAGCPWSGWPLPDIAWCEELVCGWVSTPANTWSNLGYLAAAVLMFWQVRGHRWRDLRLFGPAAVFVGLSSFVYHMSYTKFFQYFDFVGMYVYIGLPLVLNGHRLGWLEKRALWGPYLGLVGLFSAVAALLHGVVPLQLTMTMLIGIAVVTEVMLIIRRDGVKRLDWYISLVAIGTGATFSGLDQWGGLCNEGALFSPTNHWLQGHALWHLFGAISIYFLFRFYRGMRMS